MNILRTKDYIAEKLAIKPVGKERLQGFRKYKDFFNKDNYVDCPQNTDETIYALAYALWAKRCWPTIYFNYDAEYAIACVRNDDNGFDFIFNYFEYLKTRKCEWIKRINITKNIYNSVIDILVKNNMTICSGNDFTEIAPVVGIMKSTNRLINDGYVFYNNDELINHKSNIYDKAYSFTALFIKNMVTPKYKKYADRGFFNYMDNIVNSKRGIDSKNIRVDIYGNQVQYIELYWNDKRFSRNGWFVFDGDKEVGVNLTDVIDGVEDFNIQ